MQIRDICDTEQQNMSPAAVSRTSRTGETAHKALLVYFTHFQPQAKMDRNWSPKSLRFLKRKGCPSFPRCLSPSSPGDISKLGSSPSSYLSHLQKSNEQMNSTSPCHQVPGESPLLHNVLSVTVISSHLFFFFFFLFFLKLLHAVVVCYNWITDGEHFIALRLISSRKCYFFWWSDLTPFLVLICAAEPQQAERSPVVKVQVLPVSITEIAAPSHFF